MAVTHAPVHGGNVHAAARELHRPIRSILDFSASINPLGPSTKAIHALRNPAGLVEHYPDPDCVSLKQAIKDRWHIAADRMVVGNGSTELIDLIPRALSIRTAMVVGPAYAEYERAVARAGGRTCMILAEKEEGYRPPLEKVLARLSKQRRGNPAIDAVFIGHPNSPTGQACHPRQLHRLFAAADRFGCWVVVDESFIEYCHTLSCLPQLSSHSRLIILRSFTKFYGLPGLRIGYSVSSPTVAALLRRHQPPWSVNAMAQRAAIAAISDGAHARRCLAYLVRERARMSRALSSLEGITVIPSSANFLLIELPKPVRSTAVTAKLRRQGLLIRDCSSIEGCTTRTVRIAVRARRDNERLLTALRRMLRR